MSNNTIRNVWAWQGCAEGLHFSAFIFDCDGDEGSIDGAIYSGFPKLIDAEGYKLMRLSDVGRVLVDIIVPEGGMTVPYLKDIVRQARLYVSPGKSIPLDRDKVHVHKIECRVSGVILFHHANF